MPIIDTHCHYNLEPLWSGQAAHFKIKEQHPLLFQNWQQHWQNAQKVQVTHSLVVGADLITSQKAVQIAQSEKRLYAAVGLHPESVSLNQDQKQALLVLKKIAQNKKVLAIGETGLDYFYLSKEAAKTFGQIQAQQKALFIEQIHLAVELGLRLIVHVRDQGEQAYWEALEILQEHWQFKQALIFHCVSGPLAYIAAALKLPQTYFGFDGNLTFKKADDLREIFAYVQKTDNSKILLETDAPYLAPEPDRGKICEPQMIVNLAAYVQNQLGANLSTIYQNSLQAFNLKA